MKFTIYWLLLCSFFSAMAHAQVSPPTLLALSKDQTWLKLLHYETGYLSELVSEVTTESFFLAANGQHSPLDELTATLAAMHRVNAKPNQSAQCLFPARKLWLIKVMPQLAQSLPQHHCPELNQFLTNNSATGLSLIYASGYLGNPASMYGHLLLKLNQENRAQLLENTFNYGAMFPKGFC